MLFFHASRVVALTLVVSGWAGIVHGQYSNGKNYLISFGDSYSQTGFNVTSTKPSSTNPLGNPTFPGYTTSGGPNYIGYLVKDYNTTLMYSYNFADGGATVNASLVKPYQSTVKSLIDQVKLFSDSIASKPDYAKWTSETAAFMVWIGVNDIGNSYYGSNEQVLLGQIMDSYFSQLDILYRAGARTFVLLGVPPIDKSPMMLAQSQSARDTEAAAIKQFNTLVADRLKAFTSSHTGSKGWVVDTQIPFNKAIANPTKYGSKDSSCYNYDGKTCLWYNDYHPGTVSNLPVMANLIIPVFLDEKLANVTLPRNYSRLKGEWLDTDTHAGYPQFGCSRSS